MRAALLALALLTALAATSGTGAAVVCDLECRIAQAERCADDAVACAEGAKAYAERCVLSLEPCAEPA